METLLIKPNRKIWLSIFLFVCVLCLASGSAVADTRFAVFEDDYGIGGTAGNYTIRVNGQGFDRTVTAALTNAQGSKHQAIQYYRVGPEVLYATFDLTRVSLGMYDLAVEKNSTAESQAISPGLQVIAGGGGELELLVAIPDGSTSTPAKNGALIEFQIVCQNAGVNDSYVPVIQIESNQPFFQSEASAAEDAEAGHLTDLWYPFPRSDESCPGIVLPNSGYAKSYWMESGGTNTGGGLPDGVELSISEKYTQPEEINWLSFLTLHSGVTEQERFSIIEELQSKMKNKVSGFYAMLSANARLINREDSDNDISYYQLVRIEIDKALSSMTTSISGHLSAASFETPVSNISMTAGNSDTGETFRTTSMYDGSFSLNCLSGGDYEISTGEVVSPDGPAKVNVRNREQVTGLEIPVDKGYCVDLLVTLEDELVKLPAGGIAFLSYKCEPGCENGSSSSEPPAFKRLWAFNESNTLRISGLAAGDYDVAVDIPGYAGSFASFTLLEGSEDIEEIPVNCVTGITVTGTVTGEFAQVPDKLAVLKGADEENSRHIHFAEWKDSRFEFQDVIPGDYKLTFSAPEYATIIEQVVVEADSTSYEIGKYDVPPERILSVEWTGSFANRGDDATAIIFDHQGYLIRALTIRIGTDFTIGRLAAQEYSFGIFDSGTELFESVVNLAGSRVTELQIRSLDTANLAGTTRSLSSAKVSRMVTAQGPFCKSFDPIVKPKVYPPIEIPIPICSKCKGHFIVAEARKADVALKALEYGKYEKMVEFNKQTYTNTCLTYAALCLGLYPASIKAVPPECNNLNQEALLWIQITNKSIAKLNSIGKEIEDAAAEYETERKEYEWCKTYSCDVNLSGYWSGWWGNPTTGEGGHMMLELIQNTSNPAKYYGTASATGTGFTDYDEYASYGLDAELTSKNTLEMYGSLYIDASEIEDLWFIAESILEHTTASIVDGTMWGTYTADWVMDYGGGESESGLGMGWFWIIKQ